MKDDFSYKRFYFSSLIDHYPNYRYWLNTGLKKTDPNVLCKLRTGSISYLCLLYCITIIKITLYKILNSKLTFNILDVTSFKLNVVIESMNFSLV